MRRSCPWPRGPGRRPRDPARRITARPPSRPRARGAEAGGRRRAPRGVACCWATWPRRSSRAARTR
eukprot:3008172-Alexandrium_andersonii.AAC.1